MAETITLESIHSLLLKVVDMVVELDVKVTDLALRVGRLEESVDRLEERMTRLEESVGRLEERITRLENSVGRLEERVGRLEERIGLLEERTGSLEEKVESNTSAITSLRLELHLKADKDDFLDLREEVKMWRLENRDAIDTLALESSDHKKRLRRLEKQLLPA